MPHTPIVFGSSKDLLRPLWRVWFYDAERKTPISLAHYTNKEKSDKAAFELAHAAAKLEEPKARYEILGNRDADPGPLPQKIEILLRALADDAIRISEEPEKGKATVSVRSTPDDRVHVVRFP